MKGAQDKKPEKEDIGDGGSAYFKWGQNCIYAARQATYAMKNLNSIAFCNLQPKSDKKVDDTLPRRPNMSFHRKSISEQQMLVFWYFAIRVWSQKLEMIPT